MAIRRFRNEIASIDLVLDAVPQEALGLEVVQKLAAKGFCVIDPCFEPGTLEKALAELKHFDASGRWHKLNRVIQDGLLGQEGSAVVAELESPELPDEVRSDGEMLMKLDDTITSLGLRMEPYYYRLGIEVSHRSIAVVHEAGEPDEEPAPLTEKQVTKWLAQFIRHKVMVLMFLGPTSGTLELKPYVIKETELFEVTTTPGTMVVLRPDLMSHRHFAPGRAFAISSFYLTGHMGRRTPVGGWQMIPAAKELDDWTIARLRQLKESAKEDAAWDPEIPRDWQQAMNHMYHKGQMIGIHGAGFKVPLNENPETFFRVSQSAPDFATQVPLLRWDHSVVFDPHPESHKNFKSYCGHACFMEGIELFDCRMFNMAPNEAKSTDPHQRLILEVGYASLYTMGMRKNTLVNVQCGVYVGCGNTEWNVTEKQAEFGAFAATGGALSISSGRFSFTLGLKGPSMTLDTEASSGATAVYLGAEGCQRKGRATSNEMACSIAAHILLSAVWWPSQCASKWLSAGGRCFSFDASADGYIRADGVAAVAMKCLSQVVDGEVISQEGGTLIGSIAGAMMNNNGRSATLSAPHGPAEQEVIAEAIRNASISPYDVDGVEAHAVGAFLSDAIEVGSMLRAHRSELHKEPLAITTIKSSLGNQVECGSLASFVKTLYSMQFGMMTANVHLHQANPHMDAFEQPCCFPTDGLEYRMQTAFVGNMSRGFGGSNVYLLGWGQTDNSKLVPPPAPVRQDTIQFWPGGGGKLEREMLPTRFYTIVGSWSEWGEAQAMEPEGEGTFGYIVTLGENRWEQFQIWLDGDPTRVLHPAEPKAGRDSPVLGPEDDAHGCNWMIDGRGELQLWEDGGEGSVRFADTLDVGRPGDQYRVRLRVAGKWRTVTWEKLQVPLLEDGATIPAFPSGRYFVTGSWNDWGLDEMTRDLSRPGNFHIDVKLSQDGSEFQIVRNRDWNQTLYPRDFTAKGDGNTEVLGPDDMGGGLNWYIEGRPGHVVRIELERIVDVDTDVKKVSWQRLSEEA